LLTLKILETIFRKIAASLKGDTRANMENSVKAKIHEKYFLKSIVSVLLLSFLIAFDVYGQIEELSMDEALAIFYRRNLDLVAAQYNIG
jgi:hypothetical protein